MKNIQHQNKPPKTTISLDLAKKRIKRWLDVVGSIPHFKKNPDQIPRALFISFDDIDQMIADCKDQYKDDKLVGIRVYFGLAHELSEPAPVLTLELRGMLVPVLKISKSRPHADCVHKNIDDPDPNYTNIYDFTSPCPAYCDFQSELYVSYE